MDDGKTERRKDESVEGAGIRKRWHENAREYARCKDAGESERIMIDDEDDKDVVGVVQV